MKEIHGDDFTIRVHVKEYLRKFFLFMIILQCSYVLLQLHNFEEEQQEVIKKHCKLAEEMLLLYKTNKCEDVNI